ncbi:MAG: hypothetical protein HQK79_10710 [Desulfobacterales bacterium]|nr:hypothetical protein [Desulfobacterales bacterium]
MQLIIFCLIFFLAGQSFSSEDSVSLSGKLSLRGVAELDKDSVKEDPSVLGRIKINASKSSYRLYSWIEAGWDGTVRENNHSLLKNYDKVYQNNKQYLEFKELFVEKSFNELDIKLGIQRFSWGRLDEYPVNDLLNPWDYTRFLTKPLEDRKIGIPSVSVNLNIGDWQYQGVFIPWLVPYRLPMPNEKWAGLSKFQNSTIDIAPIQPDLPSRTLENSSGALRIIKLGETELGFTLFQGYDPRPVFKSTYLIITPKLIVPAYKPTFNKITTIGADIALVKGDFSIRAESAYTFNKHFSMIEKKSDTIDYGIGVDYRLFEDCTLIMQGQQTIILDKDDLLYENKMETLLWASIKANWMNQKIETNLSTAYNPEHGSYMTKFSGYYTFNDYFKAGASAVFFDGPEQSIFGKYSANDQVEFEVIYSW